jgi:hypothetical protein
MDHRQQRTGAHVASQAMRRLLSSCACGTSACRCAIVCAALIVSPKWAAAADPALPPPPAIDGPIEYVGPDTFILLDAAGHPQPMLGMKYEDFVAAWKKSQNLQPQSAELHFVIESMKLDGDVRGDHAELVGEIVVRQLVDAQVDVPLGMASAILREEPSCKTAASEEPTATSSENKQGDPSFVDYDRERGGFIARLRGHKGNRYEVSLPMLMPLVQDGNQTSLRLNLPQSAVGRMSLDVGTTIGASTVSSGSVLTKETTSRGNTRLTAAGLATDFQLMWSGIEQQHAELAAVLSAVGNEQITIDGHSIRSDARLTVRSYGGSFDRFRVRLPPGAQLIQERRADTAATPPSYRVTLSSTDATEADAPSDSGGETQITTVEFAEKQSEPVDVELSTEQPLGDAGAERSLDLAGFEVLGAVRQYGSMAVRVADNWQLRWETAAYVRRVERLELPANVQPQMPTVAFEYDRQPWTLRARLEPRPLRVLVTPEYNLALSADEAQLHVHLNYQMPGALAFEFRVQLRGWELTPDPIESGGMVDQDRVVVSREGVLILPLGQAPSRRADVAFSLRRSLPRDETRLELPLPKPEADSVSAADLTVQTAADVELIPDLNHANGVSATPVTTDALLPTFDDGRQMLRFRAVLPEATFAATRTIRQREMTCKSATQVLVDRNEILATQTIEALVRYQPLGQLTLDVPEQWSIVGGHVEIIPYEAGENHGMESQPPRSNAEDPPNQGILVPVSSEGAMTDEGARTVVMQLPQPRLGHFAVRVRYATALPAAAIGAGGFLLPLPQPADGSLTGQELRISSSPELSVRLDSTAAESAWRVGASSNKSGPNAALELVATEPLIDVPLVINSADPAGPQATTVERIWLETWFAGNTVQDRAAFRFTSGGSAVTVELPPTAPAQEVEALLDGKRAEVAARAEGRLVIALPASDSSGGDASRPHTLELRYCRPSDSSTIEREQLTPPQLIGTSPLSQTYWQLVVPADEQLVGAPAQLVPLDQWQWLGTFLGRRPTKSQADLEAWVGATSQLAPSNSQSEYLFGGFAPATSIEIVIVPRWLIVLVASGVLLAAAVGWIYVPRARRAWVGVALAVAIASFAIAYPTPAALLGEAAILGLVGAMVAAVLYQSLLRPVNRPHVGVGSTNYPVRVSTRLDSSVTPPLSASSPLSPAASVTPAMPVHVPDTH